MTNAADNRPVVVGIDGSEAALSAALWAVDEAVDREAPLRLVHAVGVARDRSIPFDFYRPEIEYGEGALRAASSAVASTGKTVKVETDILWDSPDSALIAESRSAAIVCVGSAGIGWGAGRLLGSTAATVAEKAQCPVVVVRRRPATSVRTSPDWLVVGVDNRAGNDLVVADALEEARLRHAPVLAVGTWANMAGAVTYDELDRRVTRWRRDPDVHIYPVSSDAGLAQFLADPEECVQLAVVGAVDADQIQPIGGPHERALVAHAQCSVMVVPSRRPSTWRRPDGNGAYSADDFTTTATLLDGATVTIRRLLPADYDAVVALEMALSTEERYQRFFTVHPTYVGEWALSLTAPAEGVVALGVFETGELIGVANYVEMKQQPGYAEIAAVVAHDQHERGVGTTLLRALGHIARRGSASLRRRCARRKLRDAHGSSTTQAGPPSSAATDRLSVSTSTWMTSMNPRKWLHHNQQHWWQPMRARPGALRRRPLAAIRGLESLGDPAPLRPLSESFGLGFRQGGGHERWRCRLGHHGRSRRSRVPIGLGCACDQAIRARRPFPARSGDRGT